MCVLSANHNVRRHGGVSTPPLMSAEGRSGSATRIAPASGRSTCSGNRASSG